jgi:hypothetical protein
MSDDTRSDTFKLFEDFLRAAIERSRSALVPRTTPSLFEVHTVEQKLQGLGGESDFGRRISRALRKVEATFLKPFGQHDHAGAIEVEDLDSIAPTVTEDEEGPTLGILTELCLSGVPQAVETGAQIARGRGDEHL